MKIHFFGAAGTVTGSKHLIETCDNKRVLLDCGMFQGKQLDTDSLNKELGVDPSSIDYVILSHAHVDHTGLVPYLVKQGFTGKIYATFATLDLARLLLLDSAGIQKSDYEYCLKKKSRGADVQACEPLYDEDDVASALELTTGVNYNEPLELDSGTVITFRDAGHILGSSTVEVYCKQDNRRIVFSGDLGRKGLPVLRDPEPVNQADVLILESTYGSRHHDDTAMQEEDVARYVSETIKRGGKVLIPAFSIGRTQEMVYILHKLFKEGRIPKVKIFVDSPLATDATEVFMRHPEIYDKETIETFLLDQKHPFSFGLVHYVKSQEESMKLNGIEEPCIIISASGMIEAGRIVHHVKHHIGDERNLLLVVGYMAEGTLGRELLEGENPVMIHGTPREVRAQIVKLNSFSAHADQKGLLDFASAISGLKQIFLVHGENDSRAILKQKLHEKMPEVEIVMPERGESFEM